MQLFRTLFKTREQKYGWRFAEKCDWEPMDEILIFGKSHTLRVKDVPLDDKDRDKVTGMLNGYKHDSYSMFKMEPLFFGYIESINKTYDASRGCMITVNAKDHMKLLELSQVVTNAGSLPGHVMPSINFSLEYGLASFIEPIRQKAKLPDATIRLGLEKEQYDTLRKGNIVEIIGAVAGNCKADGTMVNELLVYIKSVTKGVVK